MKSEQPPCGFPRSARIRRRRDFDRVFASRAVCQKGPLSVHGARTETGTCRLGLAVSRKVANAPGRNRIKRRLREAFRHIRAQLPPNLDLVVVVRPHAPMSPDAYAAHLRDAAGLLGDQVAR